ncbi:hypothetical protein XPA_004708 [Xanthoria parietina]
MLEAILEIRYKGSVRLNPGCSVRHTETVLASDHPQVKLRYRSLRGQLSTLNHDCLPIATYKVGRFSTSYWERHRGLMTIPCIQPLPI